MSDGPTLNHRLYGIALGGKRRTSTDRGTAFAKSVPTGVKTMRTVCAVADVPGTDRGAVYDRLA
jgi:hypothetical protein